MTTSISPIAVNRYTLNKDLFKEGMKAVSKKSYGPTASKSMLGLIGLWLILAVATIYMDGPPMYVLIEGIVVALMCAWVALYLPWVKIRRAWKAMGGENASDLDREVRFYERFLEVESRGQEITLFYEDIVEVLQSRHLLVLVNKERVGVMSTLDGYVSGSLEEVLQKVQQYMPKHK